MYTLIYIRIYINHEILIYNNNYKTLRGTSDMEHTVLPNFHTFLVQKT